MCGNYSREETREKTIQGRKLYEEIRYSDRTMQEIYINILFSFKVGKVSTLVLGKLNGWLLRIDISTMKCLISSIPSMDMLLVQVNYNLLLYNFRKMSGPSNMCELY